MIDRIDIYLYTYCEINKSQHISASMAFYEVGTVIPVCAYLDPKGEAVSHNPIVANWEGRFPKSFIEKPYRVVITDRTGKIIFEDDYQ